MEKEGAEKSFLSLERADLLQTSDQKQGESEDVACVQRVERRANRWLESLWATRRCCGTGVSPYVQPPSLDPNRFSDDDDSDEAEEENDEDDTSSIDIGGFSKMTRDNRYPVQLLEKGVKKGVKKLHSLGSNAISEVTSQLVNMRRARKMSNSERLSLMND